MPHAYKCTTFDVFEVAPARPYIYIPRDGQCRMVAGKRLPYVIRAYQGKRQALAEWARKHGYPVYDMKLVHADVVDLTGYLGG